MNILLIDDEPLALEMLKDSVAEACPDAVLHPFLKTSEALAFLHENPVDIAVLAVPAEAAQALTDQLYQYGIRGFWNFAPCDLKLEADAAVVNVHLDEGLQVLSFRMLHKQD